MIVISPCFIHSLITFLVVVVVHVTSTDPKQNISVEKVLILMQLQRVLVGIQFNNQKYCNNQLW